MSSQKPKISFNAGPAPRDMPVVQKTEKEFAVQPEAMAETAQSVTYDGFDREEWERQLKAPAPEPKFEAEPAPRTYEPFTPTPKAAGFSPIGFFKNPQPRLSQRLVGPRRIAVMAFGAVALGVVAAMLFVGGDRTETQQATFSAPVDAIADPEATTRTAIADMTTTAAPSDLPVGTVIPTLNEAVTAALPVSAPAPVPAPQAPVEERVREALEVLSANKLRMLREGILAGIYSVETYEKAGAQRIRLFTHNARLENQTSSDLMLQAIARNEMRMSEALYTTDGSVDVETMMFNLVQVSLFNDRTTEAQKAALDMSRKIFAASPVRTQTMNGLRYYTVQEGDSLAYIALQFYGRPAAYQRILGANPDILQSPENIKTGQLLHIPR